MSSISQIRYEFHHNYSQSLCSKQHFIIHRPISSLYLPAVEKHFTAHDIAMAFHTDNILIPRVITIEHGLVTNSVYIGIQQWHDTEAAYNFITSLSNPAIETLYGNGQGGSWLVEVNVYSHKLVDIGSKNRTVHYLAPSYFVEEDFEVDSEQQQPAPLQRQSAAWSSDDMEGCWQLLGEPLTFANEELYFSLRHQNYDWVDQLLEKMESDERYRYEQPSMEPHNREPFFEDDFDGDFEETYYDSEDEAQAQIRQFMADAQEWHDNMMEQKKRTEPMTNIEFKYHNFLKTASIHL